MADGLRYIVVGDGRLVRAAQGVAVRRVCATDVPPEAYRGDLKLPRHVLLSDGSWFNGSLLVASVRRSIAQEGPSGLKRAYKLAHKAGKAGAA